MVLTPPSNLRRRPNLLHFERLDRPILLSVVQNGPIGTELAHLCAGDDALLPPLGLIQVFLVNQLKSLEVRLEVFCKEVVIVVADSVQQPTERYNRDLVSSMALERGTYGS